MNFAAGGVATPADAALMMELGAEGVFVGSGIFKSGDPAKKEYSPVAAVFKQSSRYASFFRTFANAATIAASIETPRQTIAAMEPVALDRFAGVWTSFATSALEK